MSFWDNFFCCGDSRDILESEEKERIENQERQQQFTHIERPPQSSRTSTIIRKSSSRRYSQRLTNSKEPVLKQKKSNHLIPPNNLCPSKEKQIAVLTDTPIIDNKYLFPREAELYEELSTKKIMEIIESYQKLNVSNWIQLCDSNKNKVGINLYVNREGSELTNESYLIKTEYTLSKEQLFSPEESNENTNLENDNRSEGEINGPDYKRKYPNFFLEHLSELFENPELRLKWDKGIKSKEIVKEIKNDDPNIQTKIIYTVFKSPLPFIENRSIIDKVIKFYYNNQFISFASSVDKELGLELCPIPKGEKNVRAWSILNVAIYREDEDNIYTDCYYQVDYDVR